jgi:heme/copper-type cytochrome/quinol oxidase subunit 2
MDDLASSPLRIVALLIAAVAIVPTAFLIFRMMGGLREPGASRGAQALDVLWTVVPLVGVVALVVLAGLA